ELLGRRISGLERLDRAQLRAGILPVDEGLGDARALHVLGSCVLCGRCHETGGERKARETNSAQLTLHTSYVAGAAAAASGLAQYCRDGGAVPSRCGQHSTVS